jgi:enoyl-CoA hydratase
VSYQHIRLSTGEIGELVLARPDVRNAMIADMGVEIERAVDEINASNMRVLIVRGEGKGFSAGGDFKMIEARTQASKAENEPAMRRFYGAFLSIRNVRVPTIAVLHGAAIGAGLCFAMACDLRVAAADAKLGVNFVRIGLHPGMGATYLLPRLVGPAAAAELLLTGRTIDAAEALRIGLVSRVLPSPEAALADAHALATEIATAAPIPVTQVKVTLQNALERNLAEALATEAAAQAVDFTTEDLKEAIRAFGEKQTPTFSGR